MSINDHDRTYDSHGTNGRTSTSGVELGSEAGHDIGTPPKTHNYALRWLGVLATVGVTSASVGAGIAEYQRHYPEELGTTTVEIQPGEGAIDVVAAAIAQLERATGKDIPVSDGEITDIGNDLAVGYRLNHGGNTKVIQPNARFEVTVENRSPFPGVTVIAKEADPNSSIAKK